MSFTLHSHIRQRSSLARLAVLLFLFTLVVTACSKQESEPTPEPLTTPEPVAIEAVEPEDPLKEARANAETQAQDLIMPITEQAQVITSEIEAAALSAAQNSNQKSRPAKIQQEATTGQFVDQKQVSNVMAQNQGAMKNCYERSLRRDPSLRGRVILNLIINSAGNVTKAKVSGETLHDPTINNCMEIHARTMTFPKPQGGAVSINFPFTFNPQF